jgi:general secretion pathway protein L
MNLQTLVPRALSRRVRATSMLRRFWNWWCGELLYFVPPQIRDAFDRQERVLNVTVRDSDLLVDYRHGDDRAQIDRISMVNSQLVDATSNVDIPDCDRVIVELSAAQASRRQVFMPQGAEDRLREVLGYEMDRLTPFAAKDVYFDFRVSGRDASRRVVEVDLIVALRQTVDSVMAMLADRGIRASQITLKGAASQTNLLPKENRKATSRLPVVPTLLTALAAMLAVAAIAYPLVDQRLQLSRLDVEVNELRPTALAADKVRADIAAAVEQSEFFTTRWNAAPTKISLLNELAGLMPDDTWLTRVQINGSTLRIHGESEDASSLIGLIEESAVLLDPSFSSPVTKNPRTGNDRFVIESQIAAMDGEQ